MWSLFWCPGNEPRDIGAHCLDKPLRLFRGAPGCLLVDPGHGLIVSRLAVVLHVGERAPPFPVVKRDVALKIAPSGSGVGNPKM